MRSLYKILLVNMWHSVRRSRYMMSVVLVVMGITLAAGGWLAAQTVQFTGDKLASVAERVRDGTTQTTTGSLGVSKQSSLPDDQQAGSNKEDASSSNSSGPKQSQSSSGTQTRSDEVKVASITLDPVNSTCVEGIRSYHVLTASLALTGFSTQSKTLKWHWETRIESSQSSTQHEVASGEDRTQAIESGARELTLKAPNLDEPLFITPANNTYAYSFRLRVVSPNDIASPWVLVPVQDETISC